MSQANNRKNDRTRRVTTKLNPENTAKFRAFEKRIGKIANMDAFVAAVVNQAVDSFFGSPEVVEQSFVDFVGFDIAK